MPRRFQEIKLINVNIAFRVDASHQIGTGHLMRCLALADAIEKQGANICFVSRHMPDPLQNMIKERGYLFHRLSSPSTESDTQLLGHAHWLGTSQCADAAETVKVLSCQLWDWLIVDHYALDNQWESPLRSCAERIMVIDDLGDRVHDCDILLDQNFYLDMYDRYSSKVPPACKLMLGPIYALLGPDFKMLRDESKVCKEKVERVLIFFGGVDLLNNTSRAIRVLASLRHLGLHVDVVIGAQHPKREEIESQCANLNFSCHIQTNKMAELMSSSDIAIGAGGISTWERCCLGLPAIVFCAAENQRAQIVDAVKLGVLYFPEIDNLNFESELRHRIASVVNDPISLQSISESGMRHVNGQGARIVAAQLMGEFIEIRRAEVNDSISIFHWRNDEKIRNVSKSSEIIPLTDHQNWFENVLRNTNCELLIGRLLNQVVGVVRFDIAENSAEVSIYLVPNSGFSGYGRSLLLSAEKWLKKNRPEVTALRAFVMRENTSSEKLFIDLNYQLNNSEFRKII